MKFFRHHSRITDGTHVHSKGSHNQTENSTKASCNRSQIKIAGIMFVVSALVVAAIEFVGKGISACITGVYFFMDSKQVFGLSVLCGSLLLIGLILCLIDFYLSHKPSP